jgi:hypothetical protein
VIHAPASDGWTIERPNEDRVPMTRRFACGTETHLRSAGSPTSPRAAAGRLRSPAPPRPATYRFRHATPALPRMVPHSSSIRILLRVSNTRVGKPSIGYD